MLMNKQFKQDIKKLAELSPDTIAHKLDISYETADYILGILINAERIDKALQGMGDFNG